MELLSRLNKKYNITILMVTHNDDYTQYAKQVVYMDDGRLVGQEKGGNL